MTDTPPPGLSPEEPVPAARAYPGDGLGPLSGMDDPGETLRFTTTLEPKAFLGLSLKNGLLNLITLTLWRFWGKTEVRRRVWQGIRLNGDAFEYTGHGKELFIGFLLALLVLGLPFLLIVFGAQFLGPIFAALIILPLYIFIFWLWGFGVFTAFRYMASRTTYRGIRFRLAGSAPAYGLKYLGYVVLSGITMGWFWPVAERNLAESVWDEVRFGNRRIRFRMARSEREGMYGPYAIGWVSSFFGYILLVFVFVGVMYATGLFEPTPDGSPPQPGIAFTLGIYAVMLALSPLILLVWAPYHAAKLRSITAGITFDNAGFRMNVKAMSLWWLMVVNLFFLLITLGFAMPWVQARTAKYLVERLESAGAARLDLVEQTGTGPGSGEGLADAFGFSAI